jgi:RNA polymerase sigma-70 factor (ECF subfamily)
MAFPTTQWDLLAAATLNGDAEGRAALEELCRLYRNPVLAFYRARLPSYEDACDLTQQLFERLLERRIWKRADASKGRFRSYLLTVAKNLIIEWKKNGTGGLARGFEAAGADGWEPVAPDDDAALAFDREWACSVLAAAWDRVERSASDSPVKAARFKVLRRFLPGTGTPPTHEDAAALLGVGVDHVRTLISRLRADFRTALRTETGRTVSSRAELEAELDYLHSVMLAGHGEMLPVAAQP